MRTEELLGLALVVLLMVLIWLAVKVEETRHRREMERYDREDAPRLRAALERLGKGGHDAGRVH